ncbi:MAG: arylsulfatase [Bacteroidota bacterium]
MQTINHLYLTRITGMGLTIFSIASLQNEAVGAVNTDKTDNEKPNIIYILADDLGYGDLSCYGQEKFETPHIDRLAEEGMKFLQHYSGSTVSAPSRSVLMTGRHTGNTQIRGNQEVQPEGQAPLKGSVVTVAELLQDAGYVTGAYGKWGLGYPGSEGDPNKQGFDEFYGYNCQRYAHRYYPEHLWHNQEKINLKNDGTERITYAPDLIQEEALSFIEQHQDEPFFLYLPYTIPHAELAVPDDDIMARFRGKFPEEPHSGNDYGENFNYGGYCSVENPRAVFAAMIVRLDRYVKEISNKLKEMGIDDNTIVMFTSDNGPHLEGGADPHFFNSNGPLRGHKRDLYEGGIRVPFIARWPGTIEPNRVSSHISDFSDFLPTVCDIAGVNIPENIDGISFLPELKGKEQKNHEYLYWEFTSAGGKQAIRMGNWKGVKVNINNNPDAPLLLYNLFKDKGEENSVADQYPEIVEELNRKMEEAHTPSEDFLFEYEKN